jgi:hypothetical protein
MGISFTRNPDPIQMFGRRTVNQHTNDNIVNFKYSHTDTLCNKLLLSILILKKVNKELITVTEHVSNNSTLKTSNRGKD